MKNEGPKQVKLAQEQARAIAPLHAEVTAHKRTLEALRKSEETFRAVMENAPCAIVVADRDGRILLINALTEKLFGYRSDELLGKPVEILVPERLRHRHAHERTGYTAKPGPRLMGSGRDLLGQRKDGSEFPVEIGLSHVETEDGLIVTAAIADISERQKAEYRRAETTAFRLAAIVESSNDAIIGIAPNGLIQSWNPAAERLLGYTADEIVGQSMTLLVPPGREDEMRQIVGKIKRGQSVRSETKALAKDGKEIDIGLTGSPIRNATGAFIGISGILHDITERKLADKELRKSEEKFRTLVETAPNAMIVADKEGCILLTNAKAEQMFGYRREELLGKPVEILLPEALRGNHVQQRRGYVTHPSPRSMGAGRELWGRRKDGSDFPIEVGLSPVETEDGLVVSAAIADISERKRAELAEATISAKSMFLANMSHEIRTPLNAVIGMTSLLLDTPLNAEQRDCAETIRASGDALLTLINDILDYSKIEIGKLELERHPFDLRRCIEEALDLVATSASEKGLNLAYLIQNEVPAVLVSDVTRLRQILVNLLGNATKFTAHGEILLAVDGRTLPSGQHEIHISVRDTGIGIPAERMGLLFQSFSQLDPSTTRKYGGTGLGLAISKRLVELMGGKIWVESEVGKGTTFHFTIVAAAGGGDLARSYLQDCASALTGKRILVVDDNTTNRRILVKQALLWSMLPSAAATGIEALDLIGQGHAFDLAILDMAMPEMDGLALALEIRKTHDARALPLIMLTSMSQRPKTELLDRVSFAAFLSRPIKASQLFDVLTNALGVAESRPAQPETVGDYDPTLAARLPLAILVAEDNAVNQKVLLHQLERFGYRADAVANGVEVLQALDRQNYDLVLMDVQMPEMDGLEATRRIRARFPGAARPRIVAMTANALTGDREMCLAAGMDGYAAKPVKVRYLRAVLDSMGKPDSASFVQPEQETAQGDLDRTRIEALRMLQDESNPRLLADLIDMFQTDAPKHLASIESAVIELDAKRLNQLAHRFLSSLVSLGLIRMSALCIELERIGHSGSVAGAAPLVAELKEAYEHGLQTLLAETGATDETTAAAD